MNKRLLSILVSLIVGITMTFGTASTVFAADNETPMVNKVGMIWSKSLGGYGSGSYSTSPVYDNGYIYTVSGNTLLKLNAETGEDVAATPINGTIGFGTIPVTVADGKAFVPLDNSSVSIVDVETMEEIQVVPYADEVSQTISPIIYDDKTYSIYVGSWVPKHGGGTYARIELDHYTPTPLIKDQEGFYWAGSYIEGNRLIVGANSQATESESDAAPCSGKANVYCINLDEVGDVADVKPAFQVDGSVCSSVVKSEGKYYFSTKGKKLYECSMDADGGLAVDREFALPGVSTCTPLFDEELIYVGNTEGVTVIDQATGEIVQTMKTPADAKFITLMDGKIYCTYNKAPGGIFNVSEGVDYFVPDKSMQNFCISSIAQHDGVMYYRNDSGYVMAVGMKQVPKEPQEITASNVSKTITSSASYLGAKAPGALTYKSSKPSVATISAAGKITPKAVGKTTITITAAETDEFLGNTKTVIVTITPKTASGVKVSAGKKKMTVKWTKDKAATGYRIAYTTDSKFKTGIKYASVAKYSTVKKVVKSLTKGKYYYVKVQEYKTVSGTKIYGPYSSAKKVKIK